MKPKNQRIQSLDSLRGVSALIVLVHHCLLMTPLFHAAHYNESYENKWVNLFDTTILHTLWAGSEAVLLFFVLSGFVLARPFLNQKPFTYSSYIMKRICRIYIPYITIMIAAVLLMTAFAQYNGQPRMIDSFSERRWAHPFSWQAALSYLLMLSYDNTNVNGPTWSLVHEMRISFFFPFLMLLVMKCSWKKAIVCGFAVFLGLAVCFMAADKLSADHYLSTILSSLKDTCYYTTFFIIGAVFSKYYDQILPLFRRTGRAARWLLFLAALILFNNDEVIPYLQEEHGAVSMVFSMVSDWIAAAGILMIFTIAIGSAAVERFLTKPLFLWLGKISYSLYLVHMVVLITLCYTAAKVLPVNLVLFVFVPVVALLLGWFVNTYVEQPAARLGNTLVKKRTARKKTKSSYKQAI